MLGLSGRPFSVKSFSHSLIRPYNTFNFTFFFRTVLLIDLKWLLPELVNVCLLQMSRLAPVFSLLAACTLLVVGQDQAVVQRYRFNISHDEIFSDNKVIPLEHQVSEFLYKGETKM